MKNNSDKLNEILANHGLRCTQSDCNGDKKITFVGIEGNGFDFNLTFTWHGEVILNEFNGTIRFSEFCKILTKLEKDIRILEIL